MDEDISINLVFQRSMLKRLRIDPSLVVDELRSDWRAAFVGEQLLDWMMNYRSLEFDFNGHGVDIRLNMSTLT